MRAVIGEYAERVWSMFSAGENLQIEVDATEVGEHPARTAHRSFCLLRTLLIGIDFFRLL